MMMLINRLTGWLILLTLMAATTGRVSKHRVKRLVVGGWDAHVPAGGQLIEGQGNSAPIRFGVGGFDFNNQPSITNRFQNNHQGYNPNRNQYNNQGYNPHHYQYNNQGYNPYHYQYNNQGYNPNRYQYSNQG